MAGKEPFLRGDSTNSSSTETKESGTETTRSIGDTNGGDATTGERIDEVSKVNLVIPEIPVPGEVKKRGRPAGWRKDSSPAAGEPEVKAKPKAKEESISAIQISALLQGVFGVIALKAGAEWNLKPEEAQKISDPLCRILERYNLTEKINELSDGATLTIALLTIIGGRLMVSLAKPKNNVETLKKEASNNGTVSSSGNGNTTVNTQSASVKGDSAGNIRQMPARDSLPLSSDGGFIKATCNAAVGQY